MGQAVSYILKSAEEEKRSNKQNLLISPIIQWATSLRNAVSYILKSAKEEKRSNKQNLQISPIIQWATSLRKAVSYILKSISEKRSNKQKLHTSPNPIIQWVCSHKCLCVVLIPMAFWAFKSYSKTTKSDHITTTPSAVFPSIDQFKVTASNIQVVENKMQLHPPNNENVKTTKAWSGEERKEAKPRERVALPVVIERKIKHYSSSQKILLVGEGDFSFSACLARAFGSASNIVATSLDSSEFLFANYKKAHSNISELMSRGAKVYHGVDATEMAHNYSLNHLIFDRIIFNFPLAGFFLKASEKTRLKRNRGLIVKFFKNAMELISEDGEIHIAHKSCGIFLKWNLPLLASNVGLRLIEEVSFNLKDYKGYNNKYGFGGDKNFDCKPSKTYKFGFKTVES